MIEERLIQVINKFEDSYNQTQRLNDHFLKLLNVVELLEEKILTINQSLEKVNETLYSQNHQLSLKESVTNIEHLRMESHKVLDVFQKFNDIQADTQQIQQQISSEVKTLYWNQWKQIKEEIKSELINEIKLCMKNEIQSPIYEEPQVLEKKGDEELILKAYHYYKDHALEQQFKEVIEKCMLNEVVRQSLYDIVAYMKGMTEAEYLAKCWDKCYVKEVTGIQLFQVIYHHLNQNNRLEELIPPLI